MPLPDSDPEAQVELLPGEEDKSSNGMTSMNAMEAQVELLPGEEDKSSSMAQMNAMATKSALKAMARSGLIGISQLNVFSAICVLFLAKGPVDMWLKVLVAPLPVVFLPVGVAAIMLSTLGDNDARAAEHASGFVLAEFIYVYVLGGITMVVMAECSVVSVAIATALFGVATVMVWRFTFHYYPKCLKSDFRKFLRTTSPDSVEVKKVPEEYLVINRPMLAEFIKRSFNTFFVLELAAYFVHVLAFIVVCEHWWQPLVASSFISPLYMLPLYNASILREGYIKKYTMGSLVTGSGVGSKVLA